MLTTEAVNHLLDILVCSVDQSGDYNTGRVYQVEEFKDDQLKILNQYYYIFMHLCMIVVISYQH